MTELRKRFVDLIRHAGVQLADDLAGAFAAVPREVFVAEGFQRRDGSWARPGDKDFLETVYRDDVLITKLDGETPISSSSQPSLMAIMLSALDVRPGARVLEIGAGTGYNSALMAALGARVVSIDVQPDVAQRAGTALDRAGVRGVDVRVGDGYAGAPEERFDRVIVTVGVAGVSPEWLTQLDQPGGTPSHSRVIVPVAHAGIHPVLDVRGPAEGPVTATVVCPAGFMAAAGPLMAAHPHGHPAPAVAEPLAGEPAAGDSTAREPAAGLTEFAGPRWEQPLDGLAYRDLWYAAGVWSRRATHAAVHGRDHTCVALLDPARTSGAAILPDGAVVAGGPDAATWAGEATRILDRWLDAGRPPMQSWRIELTLTGRPEAPIWVPAGWRLA